VADIEVAEVLGGTEVDSSDFLKARGVFVSRTAPQADLSPGA
jgi:hypothetical protein